MRSEAARGLVVKLALRPGRPVEPVLGRDGASGIRTRDLLAASQTLSQLSYGPAKTLPFKCSRSRWAPTRPCLVFRARPAGTAYEVADDKTDYSPVRDPMPEAEQRHERRLTRAFVFGAYTFWIYAMLLAGVIILVIYLLGGFGEGGGDR
jgi:hypothetical protein